MRKICFWIFSGFMMLSTGRVFGFSTNLWPGEGIPTFMTKSNTIRFKRTPLRTARTIEEIRMRKGETISATHHFVVTKKSLPMVYKVKKMIKAPCFGNVKTVTQDMYYQDGKITTLTFGEHEGGELLQARAEGENFVMVKNGNICLFNHDELGVRRPAKPEVEWWIRSPIPKKSEKAGWLLIGTDVTLGPRKF